MYISRALQIGYGSSCSVRAADFD